MAVYYVRTDGNDSNPGTGPSTTQAFKTIQKAANVSSRGDIIYVAPGTYNESAYFAHVYHGSTGFGNPTQLIGNTTGSIFGTVPGGKIRATLITTDGYTSEGNPKQYTHLRVYNFTGEFKNRNPSGTGSADNRIDCYNCDGTFQSIFSYYGNSRPNYMYCYNCVAYNVENGFQGHDETYKTGYMYCYNCIAYNCTYGFKGVSTLTYWYAEKCNTYLCSYPFTNIQQVSCTSVDPKFIDPAADNYRVAADSPMINAGIGVADRLTDPDGVPCPQGSAHDIGVYEFARGVTKPVITAPVKKAYGWPFEYVKGLIPSALSVDGSPAYVQLRVMISENPNMTSPVQDWNSIDHRTKFEFWNGSSWQTWPTGGVGSAYWGNEFRCAVPPLLDYDKFYYTRVYSAVE
ncbi:MAG: DUF1565 domain-containing protein [Peptococcaceae bacterium]|jgi:hypothetical protein|nr:MAG: DUF1565 domain-containing protein [Peptococcaceae bacterium]